MTQTLEVVHIRITNGTRSELVESLRIALEAREMYEDLIKVQMYSHLKYETDLSLHFHWDTMVSSEGSSLALQLISGIQELGAAKHTMWQEIKTQ